MATIDKFCAAGVFDPATYGQGIKVNHAQTILFLIEIEAIAVL